MSPPNRLAGQASKKLISILAALARVARLSMTPIDIILPAHNEESTIGGTLRDFYRVVTEGQQIPIRFIVCEDGSRDNTVAVVQALSREIPIHLISEPMRKGYSKAVVDGLRASTSPVVGFIDSDGQCDPNDFARLLQTFRQKDCDPLVAGSPRFSRATRR